MSDRSPWAIALATANLTVLIAGAWFVGSRLDRVEDAVARRPATPSERGRPDRDPKDDGPPPAPGTLAALEKRVAKLSDDAYDQYSEIMSDLHELKRTTKQTQNAIRNLTQAVAKPGQPIGQWALAAPGQVPSAEVLAAYRDAALAAGVKVEPGRVEVRGFLNMSPNAAMPMEYFVTRWPESGHETLVHVIGNVPKNEELTPDRLRGLITAVYKGLVVAGFREGRNSGYEAGADPDKPTWVPPTGDLVHVGVRYSLHGKVHLARASDWVIDPAARAVLPPDVFRFAGSRRQEDFDSGDEMLTAEAGGLLVSVYRNPTSMIEIAALSNLNDDFRYNDARIPRPLVAIVGKTPQRLDMVRDRRGGSLTVLGMGADGAFAPLPKAPVLKIRRDSGEIVAVPFARAASLPTAWIAKDDGLKTSPEWRVEVEVDGAPVETSGFEPLYVDLILSKEPIVPEGDGAAPLEPIPADAPRTDAPKDPAGGPPAGGK
jgi:hypothetical protein